MKKILLISSVFISFILHGQDLSLGLQAYYPFTGNLNDVSGNNNNPSFSNAILTSDHNGNINSAVHFNGIDNFIRIPNSISLNSGSQVSLCAWVKADGFYQGPCHGNSILMKGDLEGQMGNYLLRFDDNFYVNGANCTNPIPDMAHENFYGMDQTAASPGYSPYIQTGQWYPVVYTYDGTSARIYVNCQLAATISTGAIGTFSNSDDLFFGKTNMPSFPYWFNGDLDEIRIYNRVLTQQEVNLYSGCVVSGCNDWFYATQQFSYAAIGDLDVSGTQLTVEAMINRTVAEFPGSGTDEEGDVVSKYSDNTDINYLLRPKHAYINTTNGSFSTPDICNSQLNKTYHIAMVYDGSTLKFYRDGFLMSQVNATGNLTQNDFIAQIGYFDAPFWNTQFVGYINEVRIWNVARTQAQLQANMNTPLANPTTQPGLQAYYVFNNLLNRQGNPAWNAVLSPLASINATNPNCDFTLDSCNIVVPAVNIGGIINDYTPVLSLNPCTNKITVEDVTAFHVGDTVLLIQMKGAIIDSTNTNAFGTVTDYKNSGGYEFNYIKVITGNIIELKNKLVRQYDVPAGRVQLVRVPYYHSVNITSMLTCLPWDGNKGGVLVLNARDTITMSSGISVSGRGFRGGIISNNPDGGCGNGSPNYFYPLEQPGSSWDAGGAEKGEGIAEISDAKRAGKGSLANGGGGGNKHNFGGGGGSNNGNGGKGGDGLEGCGLTDGGEGGISTNNEYAIKKIFMGGGGGRGDDNNQVGTTGANGGGIIIVNTNTIIGNNHMIDASGASQLINGTGIADGAGGGGGGGVILLNNSNYAGNLSLQVFGGKGGDQDPFFGCVGTGGGGGGGFIGLNNAALPPGITTNIVGGNAGIILAAGLSCTGTTYGASPGANGNTVLNYSQVMSSIPFVPNIDSVRIKDSSTSCLAVDFKGFGYTNLYPVVSWNWYFGDGGTANTQNTSHTYGSAGTYSVKLVVTDINGCKDSITRNITTNTLSVDAGRDSVFCGGPVTMQLHGILGSPGVYSWTPAVYLDDNTSLDPTATVNATTTFYLNLNDGACAGKDSVTITVNSLPLVNAGEDTTICSSQTITLAASGAATYNWDPSTFLNDASSPSPVFSGNSTTTYYVTGTDSNGCKAKDTITINVNSPHQLIQPPNKNFCINQSVQLDGANGNTVQYLWSPGIYLSSTTVINPVANPPFSTSYIVKISDPVCNYDSVFTVIVAALSLPTIDAGKSNDIDCAFKTSSLSATGAAQYSWSPAFSLNDAAVSNPIADPASNTLYIVTGTDNNGCSNKDSIEVFVKTGISSYDIPNSFTPNGDGINDCFGIKYWGNAQNVSLIIYNRFGQKMFEAHNVNECWNGKFKGRPAEPGTYVFYLTGLTSCGQVTRKGSVVLIR